MKTKYTDKGAYSRLLFPIKNEINGATLGGIDLKIKTAKEFHGLFIGLYKGDKPAKRWDFILN